MGTVMRFITALGGVVLIAFAWGLFGYPIVQTIAEPEYADFPGGAAGIVVVLLMMGSVPLGGGVLLIRLAIRGGVRDQTITSDVRGLSQSSTSAPSAPIAGVATATLPIASSTDAVLATTAPLATAPGGATIAAAPVRTGANTLDAAPPTARDTGGTRPPHKRRTWLAMLGLSIVLGTLLVDATLVGGAFSDHSPSRGSTMVIMVIFLLLSALPLLGGLRLAHAGDPEMARLFISDLRARAVQCRNPLTLVRTSAGLAFVTALVSVPAMIIWREAAPVIGPFALAVFSLIDPLTNIRRRSWWTGALVSAASWFVLYLVTAVTTDVVSNQPGVQIGFILPLMVYPAAMVLSGLIRFLAWLRQRSRDGGP